MRNRLLTAALVLAAAPALAQTPAPAPLVEGDTVVLRGCIASASDYGTRPRSLLAWAPGDLVFDGTVAKSGLPPLTPPEAPTPFAYWLGDAYDLRRFAGEQVEITGRLADTTEGRMMVEEVGPVTEIHLEVDSRHEVALVPSRWLGPSLDDPEDDDSLYTLQVRQIEVEAVQPVGACDLT